MATKKETMERLSKLMEDLDIAMLTTIGDDGYLVSRPLSTQAAPFDGKRVFFFSEADTAKVAEIRRHPKINLAYASKDRNTYLSASGDARINRDRALIGSFWNDAMKAFFPKGKDDPNLILIEVRLRTVQYWDGPGSLIGQALTFIVARVTGNDDVMGENRIVDMETGRSRKPPGSDRPGRSGAGKKTKAKAGSTSAARKKSASTKPASAAKKRPATKSAANKRPTAKSGSTTRRAAAGKKATSGRTGGSKNAGRAKR